VLRELSLRTGDVFTLETFSKGNDAAMSPNVTMDFAIMNAYTSPEKLLGAYFPAYKVERSPSERKLYFVFHSQVREVRDYGMARKLPAFQFEGNDRGLFARIGEAVPSIKGLDGLFMPDLNKRVLFPSPKIRVSLPATDVRHALSACINMEKTRGIAWVATTRVKDGLQQTEVAYTRDAVFLE
jgi:hypothetical protein